MAQAAAEHTSTVGPRSYYPAMRRKGRPPSLSGAVVAREAQVQPALAAAELGEVPSPVRSRASRAAPAATCLPELEEGCEEASRSRTPPNGAAAQEVIAGDFGVAPPSLPQPPHAAGAGVANAGSSCAVSSAARTPEAWEVHPSELQLGERVGVGTTAEVYRASLHGTDVAVKRLRGPMPTEFQRELSVLLQLRHPNLVLFMGASTQGCPTIISELCEGGTIFQLLHQRPELQLTWTQRLRVAGDTAKGMNFLHRRRVVHRDLKSLNLLLAARISMPEDTPRTKISDFGLARLLPFAAGRGAAAAAASVGIGGAPGGGLMTGGVGTYHWMAPEVLSGHGYDEKVDVYSYGVVLYELLCRRIPFDGSGLEPVSIAVAVSRGRRPELRYVPPDCPAGLCRTMERCWAQRPGERPAFDAVLEALLRSGPGAAQCLA
mmetsp:Transcript_67873/g.150343  ORF Transcript_67873/g.150343 Transcript_67873/m.150343 type:complete len:433 (+) Transcript_67873:2-1300(+)